MLRRTFLKALGSVAAAAAVPLRLLPDRLQPTWALQTIAGVVVKSEFDITQRQEKYTVRDPDGTLITFTQGLGASGYDLGETIRVTHYGRG